MKRTFPRQLRYDVFIGDSSDPFTNFIKGDVRISVEENKMSHLFFTLANPDVHADWLRIGTEVRFYGGFLSEFNPLEFSEEEQGYKLLFKGTIYKINTSYEESGIPLGQIECVDQFYSKGGYTSRFNRYPSRNSDRSWANTTSIKASEIIANICNELDILYDVSLGRESDVIYSHTNSLVQRNQSDWQFLLKMADRLGCNCWTDIENEKVKMFFVEKGKAFAKNRDVEFVNVTRVGNQFFTGSYSGDDNPSNGFGRLTPNQILLTSVDVQEDPGMYGQHIQRITDFNDETGEYTETLVQYDENSETVSYYELDSALVEAMNKTEKGQRELDRLLGMGALSIPWEEARKYYKEKKIPAGTIDALSGIPFLGVTVNASCRGDFRIIPHESYLLRGIIRGRNLQKRSTRFYLKGMSMNFGKSGFVMDLEFIA